MSHSKQMRLLARAAGEGVACFDPFLVLQVEPCASLDEGRVEKAYQAKMAMLHEAADGGAAEADCVLASVVQKAYELLSDPIKAHACLACVDAVQLELSSSKRADALDEELCLMRRFRELFAALDSAGRRGSGQRSEFSAQRAEKKKNRKELVRAQQAAELERRQEIVEFGMGVPSRVRSQDSAGSAPNTPPSQEGQQPLQRPPLPDHVIDGATVCGAATVLRHAAVLSSLLGLQATVAKDQRRRGGFGLQSLQPADAAALNTLGQLGVCGAVEESSAFLAAVSDAEGPDDTIVFDTQGGRGRVGRVVDVKGSVAQAALWLLPALCARGQRTALTLKGQADSGTLPASAVGEGLCHLLRLFSADSRFALTKRRNGTASTAELAVAGTGDLTPAQLVEAGVITELTVSVWVSKSIPLEVGQRVAKAALDTLEKRGPQVRPGGLNMNLSKEDGVDNDTVGIFIVMRSSLGGVWCGSSLGGRGTKAEHTGERAASAVVSDYDKGGCISDFLQEHAAVLMAACPAGSCSRIRVNLPLTSQLQTAMAVTERLCPNVSFSTTAPLTRNEHGKNSAILECTVAP